MLLKAASFAGALACAARAVAFAAEPSSLVVGSVRDQNGDPVSGARIEAADAAGARLGADTTDPEGTFSIRLESAAKTLDVRCAHCEPVRVSLEQRGEVVIVIRRYVALERDVPTAADLAALPYPRIQDALGLIPFALPREGTISDRGLGGGRGLIVDDGAPIVDFATGSSTLADFPNRYVRTIGFSPASEAFRYGVDAGGGRFALDQLDGNAGAASSDVGAASAQVVQPAIGAVQPAYGVSSDDGTLARRGDADLTTPFAGGFLRTGAGAATQRFSRSEGDLARNIDLARLSYATASRRYRTFFDVSASGAGVADASYGSSAYRSSYLSAAFRLERPGFVGLAFGATATQSTATYAQGGAESYALDGHLAQQTIYAEAVVDDKAVQASAGLGATNVASSETLASSHAGGTRLSLLPSLSLRVPLGAGAYVRSGFSESLRVPSLLETTAAVPVPTSLALERGELSESALGYDGGRVRTEALIFREFVHGFSERRLDGIGASIAWQVAPLVSVRAWTLRNAPLDFVVPGSVTGNASRQILWTTYANAAGLRFDAIAHRDAGVGAAALGIDGDALVPLLPHLALNVGTFQHQTRTYYVGLRAH